MGQFNRLLGGVSVLTVFLFICLAWHGSALSKSVGEFSKKDRLDPVAENSGSLLDIGVKMAPPPSYGGSSPPAYGGSSPPSSPNPEESKKAKEKANLDMARKKKDAEEKEETTKSKIKKASDLHATGDRHIGEAKTLGRKPNTDGPRPVAAKASEVRGLGLKAAKEALAAADVSKISASKTKISTVLEKAQADKVKAQSQLDKANMAKAMTDQTAKDFGIREETRKTSQKAEEQKSKAALASAKSSQQRALKISKDASVSTADREGETKKAKSAMSSAEDSLGNSKKAVSIADQAVASSTVSHGNTHMHEKAKRDKSGANTVLAGSKAAEQKAQEFAAKSKQTEEARKSSQKKEEESTKQLLQKAMEGKAAAEKAFEVAMRKKFATEKNRDDTVTHNVAVAAAKSAAEAYRKAVNLANVAQQKADAMKKLSDANFGSKAAGAQAAKDKSTAVVATQRTEKKLKEAIGVVAETEKNAKALREKQAEEKAKIEKKRLQEQAEKARAKAEEDKKAKVMAEQAQKMKELKKFRAAKLERRQEQMSKQTPEQNEKYKKSEEKTKTEFWWNSENKNKKSEDFLGTRMRRYHNDAVDSTNATDSEMEGIEEEIKAMELERKKNDTFDVVLHNALKGVFDAPKTDTEDTNNETSILADCVVEVNCSNTLKNIQMCMRRAVDAGVTASVDEVGRLFSDCAIRQAMENSFEKDEDSVVDFTSPNRNFAHVSVLMNETFEERGHLDPMWDSHVGVIVNTSMGSAGHGRSSLVFNGNREGKSLESDYHRAITSKTFDFRQGGLISFFIKDGRDDGGPSCLAEYNELKRKEAERIARKQAERARQAHCQSHGPAKGGCNGHGKGIYTSSCDTKNWWCDVEHGRPFNPTCVCHCNEGWVGKKCEVKFTFGHCRSVGDPHPNTADGLYYNIYDAGEFKYFEHPESRSDVHILTRMAHPSISATAAVAVRVCENPLKEHNRGKCDIISFEAPNCRNRQYKISVMENNKCLGGNFWGNSYTTKNTGVRYEYPWNIIGPNVRMHTPGWWKYGWYHHQHGAGGCSANGGCRSWYGCGNWGGYLNAYLTFKSPRDGKALGLCGEFSGSSGRDYNTMMRSGHRSHHQWGRTVRDRLMVEAKDSFFKCGEIHDFGYRYSPYRFKETTTMTAAQRLSVATQALAQEFAEDRMMNAKAGAVTMKMSKERATVRCKSKKPPPMTEEALANCVEDMMMVDDDSVAKNAAVESEQEIEEAYHEAEADEADEKLELVAEAELKKPGPLDPVLQYCVEDGNSSADVERSCADNSTQWRQLRAYPAKVYAGYLDNWKYMSARIPRTALNASVRIRFFQKEHTCYCCDEFAVDNIKIETGGMPVRIVADNKFTLYTDGTELGAGEWWNPAKDTFRFRINSQTQVIGVKIEGKTDDQAKKDMGLIASVGESIVTSSTWKCKSFLTGLEKRTFSNPKFDDSNWPSAVELGENGMLPWGPRPGIAKKAFWILTQDARSKGESVYCRVKLNETWHSYSKDHLAASRWSCKALHQRQSPYAMQLDKDLMTSIPIDGSDANRHYSGKAMISLGASARSSVASLVRIRMGEIMKKNEDGALVKNVMLRLFVKDETQDPVKLCMNTDKYGISTVTWNKRPKYKDCITFNAKKKDSWVNVDITEWARFWISSSKDQEGLEVPNRNYGMSIVPTTTDVVSFASELNIVAEQRPRITLSCHGDKFQLDQDADVQREWVQNVDRVEKENLAKSKDKARLARIARENIEDAKHPIDMKSGFQ
jgi:colicin import membrane protein